MTLALALLAIPPILTNAYVGVRQTDRDAVDAARGMGMSGAQIIRSVELPLALPLIFGGIKTSTVNVIATATIAPLVGVRHARRPARGLRGLRARGPDRRLDHRRRAGDRRRGRPRRPSSARSRRPASSSSAARRAARVPASVSPRGGSRPPHEKRTRPTRHCCSPLRRRRRRLRRRRGRRLGARRPTADGRRGQRPDRSNPDNAKISLKIGSKNFTEQKVLGEIYAQGLAAAGYTRQDRPQPRRRADRAGGAQGRRDRRLPGVHRHRAAVVLRQGRRRPAQGRAGGLRGGQDRVRGGRPDRVPADAVHVLQRGRGDAGDGRQARPEEDLRPRGQGSDLTLYGSPECRQRMDCLLGLRGDLRAEVQEVRAGRHRPAPRGAELRPRRRLDRVHDRPADQAQRGGPARGRQGHVPALQPDAGDEAGDGRRGRCRTWRRRST